MGAPSLSPAAPRKRQRADRLNGFLLFLPVPLVLWLYTRIPLGAPVSLALGTVVMLSHRLYARPYALARARRRCLWCGGTAAAAPALMVRDPSGTATWGTCGPRHAQAAGAVLSWANRHRAYLRAGVLGAIAALLGGGVWVATGRLGALTYADLAAAFQVAIAATVLPLSIWGPRTRRLDQKLRAPFPVHLQALIGTHAVLWLFRLVGLAWLALGGSHLAGRLR